MKAISKLTRNIIMLATVVGFGLSLPTLAHQNAHQEQHQAQHQHKGKKHQLKRLFKRLDLTTEQRGQIKEIVQNSKQELKRFDKQKQAYRQEVAALVKSDIFDEQAYYSLKDKHNQLLSDIEITRLKTRHSIYQVLNDQQREKLAQLKQKRKQKSNGFF
jgi:protein CpxP